ncbi:MAG TPA: hypothetical protein VFE86_20235, partial [Ilumatobacteraceae bacterium]|nr:hypothetical protein [Ilumatobacteraceae bacterium]
MGIVMVVVATAPDEVAAVRARMVELGSPTVEVLAPSDGRRLLLAAMDELEADRVVGALRREGRLAVV